MSGMDREVEAWRLTPLVKGSGVVRHEAVLRALDAIEEAAESYTVILSRSRVDWAQGNLQERFRRLDSPGSLVINGGINPELIAAKSVRVIITTPDHGLVDLYRKMRAVEVINPSPQSSAFVSEFADTLRAGRLRWIRRVEWSLWASPVSLFAVGVVDTLRQLASPNSRYNLIHFCDHGDACFRAAPDPPTWLTATYGIALFLGVVISILAAAAYFAVRRLGGSLRAWPERLTAREILRQAILWRRRISIRRGMERFSKWFLPMLAAALLGALASRLLG